MQFKMTRFIYFYKLLAREDVCRIDHYVIISLYNPCVFYHCLQAYVCIFDIYSYPGNFIVCDWDL